MTHNHTKCRRTEKSASHPLDSRHCIVMAPDMNSVESRSIQEFEGWVREHQAGLRAFIRALGADEAWVDDLAQETFIIAYRRMETSQAATDLAKWLRGIARNLVANELRKEARRSRLLPSAIAEVLVRQTGEDVAFDREFNHLLSPMQECVGRLPPRSQELLRRRYSGGENATSLAREFGMQANAARQTLLRLRVAVKECIERKIGGAWL